MDRVNILEDVNHNDTPYPPGTFCIHRFEGIRCEVVEMKVEEVGAQSAPSSSSGGGSGGESAAPRLTRGALKRSRSTNTLTTDALEHMGTGELEIVERNFRTHRIVVKSCRLFASKRGKKTLRERARYEAPGKSKKEALLLRHTFKPH